MKNKNAFTIVELAFVICVVIVTIAALGPFVRMVKVRANRIDCANNLRKINLGLQAYAADHNGAFPASIGELCPDYIEDRSVFDCPASWQAGTKEKPDYVYIKEVTESSPVKTIILEDAPGNHGKKGKNVLRLNGDVEWVK